MKYLWIIAFALIFSSCKKSLTTYSSRYVEPFNMTDSYPAEPTASAQLSENMPSIDVASLPLKEYNRAQSTNVIPVTTKKEPKTILSTIKKVRTIKEALKEDKEMDPRLSRALVMTIFGGVAAGLGILFFKYAPTGLFIFAFSIVFLVGLVSLILYLANPKPKL